MPPTQVALYARVSSEPHAEAPPVASQGAALRERVATARLTVSEAMQLRDEGESGATLGRPALERWRAVLAAGRVDRLSVHAPARLARHDADQVVLVDALRRAGVEGLCLNRAWGQRPAEDRLLPVQGRSAEDARAKSIERHRRGKRPAARVGVGKGLRGAP